MNLTSQTDKANSKPSGLLILLTALTDKSTNKGTEGRSKSFAAHLTEKASSISENTENHQSIADNQKINGIGFDKWSVVDKEKINGLTTLPEIKANPETAVPKQADPIQAPLEEQQGDDIFADLFININPLISSIKQGKADNDRTIGTTISHHQSKDDYVPVFQGLANSTETMEKLAGILFAGNTESIDRPKGGESLLTVNSEIFGSVPEMNNHEDISQLIDTFAKLLQSEQPTKTVETNSDDIPDKIMAVLKAWSEKETSPDASAITEETVGTVHSQILPNDKESEALRNALTAILNERHGETASAYQKTGNTAEFIDLAAVEPDNQQGQLTDENVNLLIDAIRTALKVEPTEEASVTSQNSKPLTGNIIAAAPETGSRQPLVTDENVNLLIDAIKSVLNEGQTKAASIASQNSEQQNGNIIAVATETDIRQPLVTNENVNLLIDALKSVFNEGQTEAASVASQNSEQQNGNIIAVATETGLRQPLLTDENVNLLIDALKSVFNEGQTEAASVASQNSEQLNGNIKIATADIQRSLTEKNINLLNDALMAVLNEKSNKAETAVNQKTDQTNAQITAAVSEIGSQQDIPAENKIDLFKDALKTLINGKQTETNAEENQNNTKIAASYENADTAFPYEGKNRGKKSENTKETFVRRLAEFLGDKGDKDGAITQMITKVRNLTATAPTKTTRDFGAKESIAFAAETANREASPAGNQTETSPTVILPGGEKPVSVRNATFNAYSAQDAKIMHEALPASQRPVPGVTKIKNEDKTSFIAGRDAKGVGAAFSDLLTSQAKTPQSVRLQSMIDQISLAKQQIGTDGGRVKITLNPPNLGTIDLEVIVRQNRVNVTMIADHASAQQLLQAHADEVKSALQRQDMKIDHFQVSLQNNGDDNQQPSGHWASMEGRNPWGANRLHHSKDTVNTEDTPFVQEKNPLPPAQGLVSVFA
ncbi:MAG: flagellar hook-length control protein FliK [Deltaproteobacteria bacterium]|nr:flagellar hook-length control protein FliK [Deltaproteobacteria bacterium]